MNWDADIWRREKDGRCLEKGKGGSVVYSIVVICWRCVVVVTSLVLTAK